MNTKKHCVQNDEWMSSVASEARRPRHCKSPQNSLLEELVIGLVTSASLVDNYVLFIHYRLDKNKVTIFETFSFKIFLLYLILKKYI